MKSYNNQNIITFSNFAKINPFRKIPNGNEVKFVSMEDIDAGRKFVTRYSIRQFKGGSKFRNGDTLMARITPSLEHGKTAFVNFLNEGEVGGGSTEFIVLSNREGVSLSEYVYYLAISSIIREPAIKSMSGTSGRQRVDPDIFEQIQVPAPDLDEQQAIVKILSDLDEKIELNNQMNKTLEEIAQAIFKRWFIDFEFPNENGEPYKSSGGEMVESELGMIPKGWEVKAIKNIGNVVCGKTPSIKVKENFGFDFPFITIPDMHGNTFVVKTERYLSHIGMISQKNKLIPPFSICVSCIATPGLVSITSEYSQTNQQINSIVCHKNDQIYFTYLNMKIRTDEIKKMGLGGSATLNLNTTDFGNIKMVFSDVTISAFDRIVAPLFLKILANSKENLNLALVRDLLLPKLMTGKIRVPLGEQNVQ